MSASQPICRVAVPSPVYRLFDYLAPKSTSPLEPGTRLRVPFGRRAVVGILHELVDRSELPHARLKSVQAVLDETPLFPAELYGLLTWVAAYYHHPLGEVLHTALPVLLRRGRPAQARGLEVWTLAAQGKDLDPEAMRRAPRRKRLLEALRGAPAGLTEVELSARVERWRAVLREWLARGWVERGERDCLEAGDGRRTRPPGPRRAATGVEEITAARGLSLPAATASPAAARLRSSQDDRRDAGARRSGAAARA